MFVDTATLQDLEAMPTPMVRGATLWNLINRTRTRVGNEALRKRLLNPPHAAKDILALQRAHQALDTDLNQFRQALDGAAADDVERYLNMSWQLPNDMPATARFTKWYRRYTQDVARGRTFVASLLESGPDLGAALSRSDAPMLREIGSAIADVVRDPNVQELRRLAALQNAGSHRHFDQLARETVKESIARLLHFVGEVEALWSVAAATSEHGWTYPRPSSPFRVAGLFHPFLGATVVPNDLDLARHVRVCFVTGPNMAGKSTFLKAIGLALLLAHIGSGVPATAMDFVPVGTLFSSIQIADNLRAGESFYLAEVRRVGALASALDNHSSGVAILDEPFRGTNVHDAAEATLAIISRLAAHPTALVFVASHLGEVVPAILGDPRISFLNFAADVTGDQPSFDYRLREGVSEQRLGMTLLRQEGVLDRLERSAESAKSGRSSSNAVPSLRA
jgi:DNA mismatch repair ATPase MutS